MTLQELRKETVALAKWFEERGISPADSIIVMAALIPASLRTVVHGTSKTMQQGGRSVGKLIMDNIRAEELERHESA